MNMKVLKKSFLTTIAIILSFALGASPVLCAETKAQGQTQAAAQADDLYDLIELFTDGVTLIRSDYVEAPKSKDIVYGALRGMLSSLDPYSQFMDPDAYREMKVETKGEFGGLGIEITIKDGLLTIISPIEGTPAYAAGLKPNDRIVKIDGESTKDIALVDAVKKLRGKPGTKVELTILREKDMQLAHFTITRAIIKLESIKRVQIVKDGIGYIRLVEFQENTPKDLDRALEELKAKQMTGLILDVRNNPGGLLDISADVAEMFIPEGTMLVYTKGRIENQNMEFKSKAGKKWLDAPMCVLVNEGSASASEILAGALKDNHRAVIVGVKTFGKGSVQSVIPLRDGSAVRLTTAKYYLPGGEEIHKKGITPDIEVEYAEPSPKEEKGQLKEVFEEIEKEEKKAEPAAKKDGKIELPKKEELVIDSQLQAALDVIKGIAVYDSWKKSK